MVNQWILLPILGIAATQPRIIDILFNENHLPIFPNVTVPGRVLSQTSNLDALIIFQENSYVEFGERDHLIPDQDRGIRMADDSVLVPASETHYIPRSPFSLSSNTKVFLGLGRGGKIMYDSNTVSILRNFPTGGVLIRNDTNKTFFNSSCLSESISRIPFATQRVSRAIPSDSHVVIQHRLVWPGRELGENPSVRTWIGQPIRTPNAPILSLPSLMTDEVLQIITDAGGEHSERIRIISNCSREILINQLPEIHLSFVTSGVTLFPDDYIKFNTTTNECVLNFVRKSDLMNFFNPLGIQNMNIHITSDDLFICDAAPPA